MFYVLFFFFKLEPGGQAKNTTTTSAGWINDQLLLAHMETSSKLSWWSWLFSWLLYFCFVLQKCFDLLRLIFVFLFQFEKRFKENFICPPKINSLLMWVLVEEYVPQSLNEPLLLYHSLWFFLFKMFFLILDALSLSYITLSSFFPTSFAHETKKSVFLNVHFRNVYKYVLNCQPPWCILMIWS